MPAEDCPLCGQPVTQAALDRHARRILLKYLLMVAVACLLAMASAVLWLRLVT